MDVHTKEQRSYNMSRVKSKNTKPELLMFSLLKGLGYKFKKHFPITGKPDIAFPDCKVVVFIDGEFWHGKDFFITKDSLQPFWVKKIGDNLRRDRKVTRKLRAEGWHVLRLWDKKVLKHPERAVHRIINFVARMKVESNLKQ